MTTQNTFYQDIDESFTVINACFAITEQYRTILAELGKEHQLSENEMLVLVHLSLHPEACTQKKLQATNLHLSVSSVCRMVESLRRKGYVTTELDENDRRSWIIHLEEEGRVLAGDFRVRLRQRLEEMFGSIPGFDLEQLLQFSRATLAATSGPFAVGQTAQ
jgi:DNA-binding MarR family transcriptional regulator